MVSVRCTEKTDKCTQSTLNRQIFTGNKNFHFPDIQSQRYYYSVHSVSSVCHYYSTSSDRKRLLLHGAPFCLGISSLPSKVLL